MDPYLTYRSKNSEWQSELDMLRELILTLPFDETIKWGVPYYQLGGKNLIGLTAFKSFVSLWFTQGALLNDHAAVLVNASPGATKAQRQWRFRSLEEIEAAQQIICDYLYQTTVNHASGKEMKAQRQTSLVLADEVAEALIQDPELQNAFKALSQTKQREYSDYIDSAKQAATKQRRLDKILPLILAGHGLNDKYRR